jgi:hypothetical protein
MSFKEVTPSTQVLDQLAERIRAALEAVRQGISNALENALEAGDALNAAQQRVSSGWGRWLHTNCSLKPSTASLYQQLARHRLEIEAKVEEVGVLSLRAARRLVTKKPKTKPRPPKSDESEKPTPDMSMVLFIAMQKATDTELTEALAALSIERFLRVMPIAWRPQLEARAARQMLSLVKTQHPNARVKNLNRRHLKLVSNTECPPPTSH